MVTTALEDSHLVLSISSQCQVTLSTLLSISTAFLQYEAQAKDVPISVNSTRELGRVLLLCTLPIPLGKHMAVSHEVLKEIAVPVRLLLFVLVIKWVS